jgi:hypothetical protein
MIALEAVMKFTGTTNYFIYSICLFIKKVATFANTVLV